MSSGSQDLLSTLAKIFWGSVHFGYNNDAIDASDIEA